MKKHARGTRWVDSRIQGALIGRTLFHWLFFVIATLAATSGLEQVTVMLAGEPENARPLSLAPFWEKSEPLAIVLLVFLPIFCLDLVLWSHRIVGPMVKIRRALQDLASGKSIQPIQFRAGDYWSDLADDLNRLQKRIACQEARPSAEPTPAQEDQIRSTVASLKEAVSVAR